MAHQAILAAHKRQQNKTAAAANLGGSGSASPSLAVKRSNTLRQALKAKSTELYRLFGIWDENGDGAMDEREFRRAIEMLGLKCSKEDFESLCALCDFDKDGKIDMAELTALVEATEVEKPPPDDTPHPNMVVRSLKGIYWFISLLSTQSIMYLAFVLIFQSLTESLRQVRSARTAFHLALARSPACPHVAHRLLTRSLTFLHHFSAPQDARRVLSRQDDLQHFHRERLRLAAQHVLQHPTCLRCVRVGERGAVEWPDGQQWARLRRDRRGIHIPICAARGDQ